MKPIKAGSLLSSFLFWLATTIAHAQTAQTNLAVTVFHAPSLNGGAIQGSLQQLNGENVTVNGGFVMTGDLLVPGTPTLLLNGDPTYSGTIAGSGSTSPSGYQVTFNGDCSLRYLRTRTTPVSLPTVSAPPSPTGTRSVNITSPGQSYGNATTLCNLTLNGNVGMVSVPPGTYGTFTVNGGSGLILGVAGGLQAVNYNLQSLNLNGSSTLEIVGPIILTVASGFTANGMVGASNNPAWLQLQVASGGFTLNGGCTVYGLVLAPNGTVIVNGDSTLVGTSASDQFTLNGGGLVKCSSSSAPTSQPPVATNQTVTLAENSSTNLTLTGTDAQGLVLTYAVLTQPAHGTLSGTPPAVTYRPATNYYGSDAFTFNVSNGLTNSAPATVSLVVSQVYYPPVAYAQSLTNVENTALAITLTGSDPQGYTLAYSVLTPPAHGTLTGTAPSLTYLPATNYYGSDAFTFRVSDGVSNSAAATISLTNRAVDYPPVVAAGANQAIVWPGNQVSLAGTVSYANYPGTVDTVRWSVVSGPGVVTFGNAASAVTTATFSTNGMYQLQLSASDSYLSASNSLWVTVDQAPVVYAGTNQVLSGTNQVSLAGIVTDDGLPLGAELTTVWGVVSGPANVAFNPTVQTSPLTGVSVTNPVDSTAIFTRAGLYVLSLTADDSLATNSATVSISVTNTPLMVYAGPDLFVGSVPATVTLDGQVTDEVLPPGGALSQQWSVLNGPAAVNFSNPTAAVTAATFSTNGIYVLELTANNGESAASSLVEVRVETLCTVEDPQGLAAWWPADGTAVDALSGNVAILGGGTGYTNGEVALAFNFNGTSDFVRQPAETNYNVGTSAAGLTMEFWMNPNGFNNGSVLGWANGVRVERASYNWNGSTLRCYLGTGGQYVQAAGNVWNNTSWNWTHVAVTYDQTSGNADLYVNGVLAGNANVGTNLLSTAGDFYLGQVPGSSGFYSGQLDEISLYRRPLNPQEVYSIYASGSVGKCPADTNTPPVVYAGPDFALPSVTNTALLDGVVTDANPPAGSTLQVQWSEYYGPGTVNFGNPTSAVSTVTFSTNGIYVLQLTANNGDAEASSLVEARVGISCNDQDISGLAAWWPANGTPKDIINGNVAILGGGTGYTNGEVALAFNFNGASDFVRQPAETNYNVGTSAAGLTMEFWMNPNGFNNGSVLGWANGVRVERASYNWTGSTLRCYLGTGGQYVQAGGNVWNNTSWNWTHVAVTYDQTSGNADLYVNGVLAGNANVGTNLLSTAGDFYLGQVPGSSGFYSGQLDEISLYRRPLGLVQK